MCLRRVFQNLTQPLEKFYSEAYVFFFSSRRPELILGPAEGGTLQPAELLQKRSCFQIIPGQKQLSRSFQSWKEQGQIHKNRAEDKASDNKKRNQAGDGQRISDQAAENPGKDCAAAAIEQKKCCFPGWPHEHSRLSQTC